jgi:hypothetical protein
MNEMPRKAECQSANLTALQRDLKAMAAQIKSPDQPASDRSEERQGLTLVIRGK